MTDDPSEIVKLARVWDARGLLFLSAEALPEFSQTRVFNNFKDLEVDRQIGDGRGMNLQEGKILVPSRRLPAGSDLVDLYLEPRSQFLQIFATDRRDFYHQFFTQRPMQ